MTHAIFRKKFIPLLVLLFLLISATVTQAANYVNILIYHRVGDDRYPTTNVSTQAFSEQMAWLMTNNYHVIRLADLLTLLKNKINLQPKTVVITFDDGYSSVYENAWPILKSFGYPFSVFLYTEGLEKGYANYMTWNQVAEMQDAGVDFEDHSYGHHHMAFKPADLDEVGYRAWISGDMAHSMTVLSRRLGNTPRFFALPYGDYNDIVLDEAKKIGYQAVLTQDPGMVGDLSDIFALPRHAILGNEWASMAHFAKIMRGADLPLTEMNPPPQQLADPLVPEFSARMLNPDDYVKGSFGFWISGLGWHQAQQQGDRLYFKNDKPLTRMVSRVVVSAREKKSGKLATRTWMLIHPNAKEE